MISLFELAEERRPPPGRVHVVEGMEHYISDASGHRLARLAERFELVWATGWEHRAAEHLPELLGLAGDPMRVLTFDGRIAGGSAHWKIDAIDHHAGQRPLAWIDDNLDFPEIRAWADAREAPTLLVPTEPATGMAEDHVRRLLEWADQVERGAARSEETAEPR